MLYQLTNGKYINTSNEFREENLALEYIVKSDKLYARTSFLIKLPDNMYWESTDTFLGFIKEIKYEEI